MKSKLLPGSCVDKTAGDLGHYLWEEVLRRVLLQGARVDDVTRLPSWYMEKAARGTHKKDRH